MEFVLDDEIRGTQRLNIARGRPRLTLEGPMRIRILDVGGSEAVPRALLLDLAEEHRRSPEPRQLGELIDGRDQQRRQPAVDLLVDHQDREPRGRVRFGGVPWIEVAARGRARHECPGSAVLVGLDLDVATWLDVGAAPGAVLELVGTAVTRRVLVVTRVAGHRLEDLVAVVGPIRRGLCTHPETDPERFVPGTPPIVAGGVGLAADHLGGADQRGRPLELLQGEQSQGVPHEDGHARRPAASVPIALETPESDRVGGEPQVRLGLAATGREPEQVGDRVGRMDAFVVGEIGRRLDVQDQERELKDAPRAVPRVGIDLLERRHRRRRIELLRDPGRAHLPHIHRPNPLLPHREVGELERLPCLVVGRQDVDALGDAIASSFAAVDRSRPGVGMLAEPVGASFDPRSLSGDPLAVGRDQGPQGGDHGVAVRLGEGLHVDDDILQALEAQVLRGRRGLLGHLVGRGNGGEDLVGALRIALGGIRPVGRDAVAHRELHVVAVPHRELEVLVAKRILGVAGQ